MSHSPHRESHAMVRHVRVSPECPAAPLEPAYWFDDVTDCEDTEYDSISAGGVAEGSAERRNLAGVVPPKPVAVKSRRKRGRPVTAGGGRVRSRQVSVSLLPRDWRLLRDEAARRRVSMSELVRRCLIPRLDAWEEESEAEAL